MRVAHPLQLEFIFEIVPFRDGMQKSAVYMFYTLPERTGFSSVARETIFPPVGDPQVLDRTAYTCLGIASAGGFFVLAKKGEIVNVAEIVSHGRYVQERLKQTVAIAKVASAEVGEALGLRAG